MRSGMCAMQQSVPSVPSPPVPQLPGLEQRTGPGGFRSYGSSGELMCFSEQDAEREEREAMGELRHLQQVFVTLENHESLLHSSKVVVVQPGGDESFRKWQQGGQEGELVRRPRARGALSGH